MARVIEGDLDAKGLKFGVIVSRFNLAVTEKLLTGALAAIAEHGGAERDVDVVRVPGAFEIPLIARGLAATRRYDALICLGAVVRGDTPHFDYIARAVTRGITDVIAEHRVPVAFGVLTTDNIEQALARAGAEMSNKGFEAALTAIEMATLQRALGKTAGRKARDRRR
jgi:6,7-dimethyl-8-ribityllumazine synthase